ncbi:hypothetical protein F5883DRAFT_592889 [Diaporthe sp. PMI_573]|nr:hypothetical protein F5883DRAFT_592889 [Diaporthaceae sp. PMI_573]
MRPNINDIPVQKQLQLISGNIPKSLRMLVSESLKRLPPDAKLGIEGRPDRTRNVCKEVLRFWSSYFNRCFSENWGTPEEVLFSSDIITWRSLNSVIDFLYSGKYTKPATEGDVDEDWGVADYLMVRALKEVIDSTM